MLTMTAGTAIFLLALCFVCVSSNDEQYFDHSCEKYSDPCETHTFSPPLGSSVLLPCNFATNNNDYVSWSHSPGVNLVILKAEGRIKFLDPRHGRVKAFPNQGLEGNYSICIDRLKHSDLGCYRCQLGQDCLHVQLNPEKRARSRDTKLLIYICVGVGALILLSICGYCCMICIHWCFDNRTQDSTINLTSADAVSAPATLPVDGQQRGANGDNLVYENDDQDPGNQHGARSTNNFRTPGAVPDVAMAHPDQGTSGIYPNLDQFNLERMESQNKKRQRFHRELFSRIRQASFGRHYYVNQGEISRQQAMSAQAENQRRAGVGKKKAKDNCEFRNPIYNRSTEQLNQQ